MPDGSKEDYFMLAIALPRQLNKNGKNETMCPPTRTWSVAFRRVRCPEKGLFLSPGVIKLGRLYLAELPYSEAHTS